MSNIIEGIKNNPYGFCGIVGFVLAIIYIVIISKIKKLKLDDLMYIYVWSALAAILGAKILYILVSIPMFVINISKGNISLWESAFKIFVEGGFVFYGGLIGAIIMAKVSCNYFKFNFEKMINVLIPVVPLIHFFGRIGCLLAGCCHGIRTELPFGITYTHSIAAPNGVKLFPVQAIEAIFDLLIFIILVIAVLKNKDSGGEYKILKCYLLLYSIIRFILEFFRGDEVRGFIGPLSTSQWISLAILIVLFISTKINYNRNTN